MIPENIIKSSGRKIYLTITGGGTHAISKLLSSGGASSVFVGANIPYSEIELREIIPNLDKSVTKSVSTALALDSKRKSEDIGVGLTCKLVKNNERSGREHLVFLTISDRFQTKTIEYKPKESCRVSQEIEVGNVLLEQLARFISDREVVL